MSYCGLLDNTGPLNQNVTCCSPPLSTVRVVFVQNRSCQMVMRWVGQATLPLPWAPSCSPLVSWHDPTTLIVAHCNFQGITVLMMSWVDDNITTGNHLQGPLFYCLSKARSRDKVRLTKVLLEFHQLCQKCQGINGSAVSSLYSNKSLDPGRASVPTG